MRRVLHLMRKEIIELKGDPRLFGIVILAPIVQLSVLGYAATTDVKDIPIAIVAVALSRLRPLMAALARHHRAFEVASGLLILSVGGLVATNSFGPLAGLVPWPF